jgi:hypothetical protein
VLDPLEPVLRRLLVEWPDIKAPHVTTILHSDQSYVGSADLVRRRLARLRSPSAASGPRGDGATCATRPRHRTDAAELRHPGEVGSHDSVDR